MPAPDLFGSGVPVPGYSKQESNRWVLSSGFRFFADKSTTFPEVITFHPRTNELLGIPTPYPGKGPGMLFRVWTSHPLEFPISSRRVATFQSLSSAKAQTQKISKFADTAADSC
eukprot:2409053-Rhodomonas_salina.1